MAHQHGAALLAMIRCSAAGLLAALGPVLGRLASTAESSAWGSPPWLLPVACSIGVVLCNVGMWALYISGMEALSSLQATVINSGTNIVWSGLLGWVILGEGVSARWMAGVALISVGVALLTAGSHSGETEGTGETGQTGGRGGTGQGGMGGEKAKEE